MEDAVDYDGVGMDSRLVQIVAGANDPEHLKHDKDTKALYLNSLHGDSMQCENRPSHEPTAPPDPGRCDGGQHEMILSGGTHQQDARSSGTVGQESTRGRFVSCKSSTKAERKAHKKEVKRMKSEKRKTKTRKHVKKRKQKGKR